MQGPLSPRWRPAAGLALAFLVLPAAALEIGDIEVRSGLGEPLDARAPLSLRRGEHVEGSCFSLLPATPGPVPALEGARLSVHTFSGGRKDLRIRSAAPVVEPASTLKLRAACRGEAAEAVREFIVLVDPPRREGAGAPSAPPRAAVARAVTPPTAPKAASTTTRAVVPATREMAPATRTPAPAKRAETPAPTALPSASEGAAPAPAARAPAVRGPEFVLKLSSSDMDLARSRGIDDRARARLRERQLVLDADDHVAAFLALRHNVRQLESRVAELQLKLSTLPQTLAPAAAPKAQPVTPAPAEPRQATPQAAPPAKPAAAAKPQPAAPAPRPAQAGGLLDEVPDSWLHGLLAAVLLALLGIAAWVVRRRRAAAGDHAHGAVAAAIAPDAPSRDEGAPVAATRAEAPSDAALSTRLPENSRELRRRYIEERFPEIANRTLPLGDPSAVVKAARLYYEDGNLARAVELLQFCIEENPAETRFWLALFEIFRIERLPGEYAELARRFRDRHGETDHWRKVRYFGREIDPGNPLYRDEPVAKLETIGPHEARRLALANAVVDPIAENWLEAPMDFDNQVLASELRRKLMTGAGITEQDLAPNTLPVLRNVEMFQVA